MGVHNIRSKEEFATTINSNKIVIVDAFATWCGPCKVIAPQIVNWSEDPRFSDKVYFAKFDVDELPELAQELGIRAMPTFTFFVDGKKADEFVGANPQALLQVLEKQVLPDASAAST